MSRKKETTLSLELLETSEEEYDPTTDENGNLWNFTPTPRADPEPKQPLPPRPDPLTFSANTQRSRLTLPEAQAAYLGRGKLTLKRTAGDVQRSAQEVERPKTSRGLGPGPRQRSETPASTLAFAPPPVSASALPPAPPTALASVPAPAFVHVPAPSLASALPSLSPLSALASRSSPASRQAPVTNRDPAKPRTETPQTTEKGRPKPVSSTSAKLASTVSTKPTILLENVPTGSFSTPPAIKKPKTTVGKLESELEILKERHALQLNHVANVHQAKQDTARAEGYSAGYAKGIADGLAQAQQVKNNQAQHNKYGYDRRHGN